MSKNRPYFERRHPWRERAIAIFALINLLLVFFDTSYLYGRDFYLQTIPGLTEFYDPIKGIRPHFETENYLRQVEELEAQVVATGLRSPQVENQLDRLRNSSVNLIEDNPFEVTNKSRILAKIKDEIRQRTGENSARDAFATFWSSAYLDRADWQQEIAFWNAKIKPLIQTNYYRDVGQFGKFIDYFWAIDLPFILVFALDLLSRIASIQRRHPEVNWLEAMLRRWYDLFLLLPFWRWLRVIPVAIRLYHTGFLNLEPVRAEAQRDFVIGFAAELTEMVGIQVIDQMQKSIQLGEVVRWIFHPETRQPYIQVNETDEVEAITTRLVNVGVYDVLPKVQPDIENLVHHSIVSTLNQFPGWQQLQNLPGFNYLPSQLTENVAKSFSKIAYNNLVNTLEDPVAAEITARLSRNFQDALEEELQKKHNLQELQTLLVDLLEEIKINYVKAIEEVGIEKMMEETERLQHKIEAYANMSSSAIQKRV
ncbi:MAG: hypothetical protein MUE44_25455 [Oscillatoriaceae cyanobacterium Prado104]|jgi:hypothetical protein|nr:hypothetical protein [Oscillatoriaceae cyanobacterium Prado104]